MLVIWSLLQIQSINQDIYAYVFTISDVAYSSSYNFWYNSLPYKIIFFVILILWGWFSFVGLIELVWHYLTGARDTGKFIVTRTFSRKVITSLFNTCVLIFLILYTASLSMILVWWILGAILNPQKFLPMALGSAVLVGFSVLIATRIRNVKKSLDSAVSQWIDASILSSFLSTIEKEKEKLISLISKPIEMTSQRLFYQSINSFMKLSGLPSVEKEITDEILEGDAGAIAILLHSSWGVEKNISLGLVGMLINDNMIIMNSIHDLSEEHGLDGDFSVNIAEIAFDDYNPDSQGINQVKASVILSVKKLLTKIYSTFPSDTIDGILQVSLESDPQPMEEIAKKLKIPSELFEIMIGVATENEKKTISSLDLMIKEILPSHYASLFNAIYSIIKNEKTKLSSLAKLMNIENKFYLDLLISVLKKDVDSIRNLINEFAPQFIEIAKKNGVEVTVEQSTALRDFLLGMQMLIQGSDIQIGLLIKRYLKDIDPVPAQTLYMASKWDRSSLDKVISDLGFTSQKDWILEFLMLITNKGTWTTEISAKIGIFEENKESFEALVGFVLAVTKYRSQVQPKILREMASNAHNKNETKILYREVLEPIKAALYNNIIVLVKNGAIDARKKIIKKKNIATSLIGSAANFLTKVDLGKWYFVSDILYMYILDDLKANYYTLYTNLK